MAGGATDALHLRSALENGGHLADEPDSGALIDADHGSALMVHAKSRDVPSVRSSLLRKILMSMVVGWLAQAMGSAIAQTLPNIRTTFVPRLPAPNECYQFSCFGPPSYDGSTLGAIGALEPVVHVYRRIPAGPWYAQAILRNRSMLPPGYTQAGYRAPIAVVGDDILVTAFQYGPNVPERCQTYVLVRNDTRWSVKQIIDRCADSMAKDGNRVLIDTVTQFTIYVRGSDGLFTEESRVLPPSDGFFAGERSIALHAWTVVVGKPAENGERGAAYIFQRRSGEWALTQTLRPDSDSPATRFGHAVGVYEYNVAVSAPGAVSAAGVGRGRVYLYTGLDDDWFVSQQIAEPDAVEYPFGNVFGTALGFRGRRLIVSTYSSFATANGPPSYLYERGMRESAWVARATLAGDAQKIDLFGNTAMLDRRDVRSGSHPTVVVLPALRELDVAP